MQKYESQSKPQTCTKIKSKLIIGLNLKCKTLNNLEKKKEEENLLDLGLGEVFLDNKSIINKKTINWISSKLKTILTTRCFILSLF